MVRYPIPRRSAPAGPRPAGARLFALLLVTVLAASLLPAGVAATKPTAKPAAASNTPALLNPDGSVVVTGPLDCAPLLGQTIYLRVTLTQPGTGALAETNWSKPCSSDLTSWRVTLSPSSGTAFQLGPAESGVMDSGTAHQWISIVTLVSVLPPGTPVLAPPPSTLLLVQNATLGPLLTDWRGFTVYTFANDASDKSACTGDCAVMWPPLPAAVVTTLPVGTAGEVGVITRDDGTAQVTYNHQPLYLYAGDLNLGDTNGDGSGGVWHVVAPQAA
jgi:predicted lipoprotein with Yx(FWY)xxD motif